MVCGGYQYNPDDDAEDDDDDPGWYNKTCQSLSVGLNAEWQDGPDMGKDKAFAAAAVLTKADGSQVSGRHSFRTRKFTFRCIVFPLINPLLYSFFL